MKYVLRDNQELLIKDTLDFIHNDGARNGLVVAPVAFGKSLCIANLAKELGEDVLCIQPSVELLNQNYDKYLSYGNEAAIYSASLGQKDIGNVTFATPISVANNAKDFKHIKTVIADEIHLGSRVGGKFHDCLKTINPKKVVGLTASPVYLQTTPFGSVLNMMNRTNKSFFKKIVHVSQIQDMVSKRYWSSLSYENRYVDTSMLVYNTTGSDFSEGSMLSMYEANNTEANIIKEVEIAISEGRKSILVFVPLIDVADDLASKIEGAYSVSSKTPKKEREDIIYKFKNGDIQVVINVNLLSTGFDHPGLDCIITARPTASLAMYYQQLGRGVRILEGKIDCKVVDLAGNSYKFGAIEDINFHNLDGYGWGMFSGDRLISGIPLSESMVTTKQQLQNKGKQHLQTQAFWFGKYSGNTIQEVFKKDPRYLGWIASDDFKPSNNKTKQFQTQVSNFIKQQLL